MGVFVCLEDEHVGSGSDGQKGGVVNENKEPTTSQEEDVEAHGYVERPVGEQPSMDANTEELDDVEAHGFVDRPVADRPVAD
jgi:hypothetical protein